jgi:hypothetical protein
MSSLWFTRYSHPLVNEGSFFLSLVLSMAHVKSTGWPISSATAGGSGGKGFEERTITVRPSDAGSPNDGGDARVESSCSHSFYFGPSTVTMSRIRRMVDSSYFADGMGLEPGEETIPELHVDKAVLFEEFITTGLRMPLHPVLAAIVELAKYIWAVTSFSGVPSAEGFTKRYELHYQPRKMEVDGDKVHG